MNDSIPDQVVWIVGIVVMVATLGAGLISLLLISFPPKTIRDMMTGKRRNATYLIGFLASTLPFATCAFVYYPMNTIGLILVAVIVSILFGINTAKGLYNSQLMIAKASELAYESQVAAKSKEEAKPPLDLKD